MDISVCIGSACHVKGSYEVIKEFQRVLEHYNLEDKITLKGVFCLNKCTKAVSTKLNDDIFSMSKEKVEPFVLDLCKKHHWKITRN
jgi:NADH:ubiquinone oxidoreductase subunit E